mmetsp:Transcript_32998/g.84257  ORF Transcript_32998/g.84257 Transcript_32998/m.84257 type:complete len:205 (-) Transcript_32998:1035-1649(-)
MKQHRRYGEDTMRARAMLCQSRSLFQRTGLQKRAIALQARLQQLRRRNPTKITGKRMYVKSIFRRLAETRKQGRHVPKAVDNNLIKRVGSEWHKLDQAAQAKYLSNAIVHRETRHCQLSEKTQQVEADLRCVQSQIQVEQLADGPLRLSRCALSEEELRRSDDMWDYPAFSHAEVEAQQLIASAPVGPPPEADLQLLSDLGWWH